jgi:hypothetical protein
MNEEHEWRPLTPEEEAEAEAERDAAETAERVRIGKISDTVEEVRYLLNTCRGGLDQAWKGLQTASGGLAQVKLLHMVLAERDTVDDLQGITATLPDIDIAIDRIEALIETTTYDVSDVISDLDAFANEFEEG